MEFQIRNWNFFRWLSGDHLVEQHVHNLDVANWAKGDHPVEANGMGMRSTRKNAQIYDHHFIEFTYKDGSKLFSQARQMGGCWDCVTEAVHGTKGIFPLGGNGSDGYVNEHADLIRAIQTGEKLNDGWHGATSSMTAVLGRMATYSGQVVRWDDAVANGPSEMPARLALDAAPPQVPDPDGTYPVPVPGIYKAY
jgi:predicted dehydrogenase